MLKLFFKYIFALLMFTDLFSQSVQVPKKTPEPLKAKVPAVSETKPKLKVGDKGQSKTPSALPGKTAAPVKSKNVPTVRKEEPPVPDPEKTQSSETPESDSESSSAPIYYNRKGLKISELSEAGYEHNAGKRYAIVIGINKYRNEGSFAKLTKAVNDAETVGKVLADPKRGQFDKVYVMTDQQDFAGTLFPTLSNILDNLNRILEEATPDDMILFYFSGHGITVDEEGADSKGYLVLYDTSQQDIRQTGLSVNTVLDKIKAKRMEKVLLVLDACRNKISNKKEASGVTGLQSEEFTQAKVTAAMYSTEDGKVSYEDMESDFGVFTRYLLWGLEGNADDNGDKVVTLNELREFVEKGVRDWSERNMKEKKIETAQLPKTRIYGDFSGNLAITLGEKSNESDYVKLFTKRSIAPVWRSALLPGWGQGYNGSELKSQMYFISALTSTAMLYSSFRSFKTAEKDFQTASTNTLFLPNDVTLTALGYMNSRSLFGDYKNKAQNFSTLSFFVLGIYALNVVDSFYFSNRSRKIPFGESKKGLSIQGSAQPVLNNGSLSMEKVYGLSYSWEF